MFWKPYGLAVARGGLCTLGTACGAGRLRLRQNSRKQGTDNPVLQNDVLAPSRTSDSSSQFTASGRAGFPRGAFLREDGPSAARLAQKADSPVSRQGWAWIPECTVMMKVCLRELAAPQRSGLQRVRLENVGFPQPPPEIEPVQLGAWEGLKIPQTQQEGWLASRVEVGEKYPPLLTVVCMSCLWLNIGKRCLGGPPVLLLLHGW